MKRVLIFMVVVAVISTLAIGPDKQVITINNDNWQEYMEMVQVPEIVEVKNEVDGITERTYLCLKEEYYDYTPGAKTEFTADYSYLETEYKFYLDENECPVKGAVYEYETWLTETSEYELAGVRNKNFTENHGLMELCGGAYRVERDNSEFYLGTSASVVQMNNIEGTLILRDDVAYKSFFSKLIGAWNATMSQ